ncbi:procollagen-lysine,2-oxoglutarate 5-dioxygenase 1-like isoform X2 [Convolutriloba macropyga]|uniref:procollagen-lysine,2-oxoglutarate 5-dioxygenase 1-like isoform X2 n=1 Tax=Convolutriloba macropyga TaxID=536237 RepID=UPI003F5259C4
MSINSAVIGTLLLLLAMREVSLASRLLSFAAHSENEEFMLQLHTAFNTKSISHLEILGNKDGNTKPQDVLRQLLKRIEEEAKKDQLNSCGENSEKDILSSSQQCSADGTTDDEISERHSDTDADANQDRQKYTQLEDTKTASDVDSEEESSAGSSISDTPNHHLQNETIVLFINSPSDALFTQTEAQIVEVFHFVKVDLLFPANKLLVGDDLPTEDEEAGNNSIIYDPEVELNDGELNLGGFVGRLSLALEIVRNVEATLEDSDTYETMMSRIFAEAKLRRTTQRVEIDNKFIFFQTFNQLSQTDVAISNDVGNTLHQSADEQKGKEERKDAEKSVLLSMNVPFQSAPPILMGIDDSHALIQYYLKAYLVHKMEPRKLLNPLLDVKNEEGLPKLRLLVFLDAPVPFLQDFFWNLVRLEYPEKLLSIHIYAAYQITKTDEQDTINRLLNQTFGGSSNAVPVQFTTRDQLCLSAKVPACTANEIRIRALKDFVLQVAPETIENEAILLVNSSYHITNRKTLMVLARSEINVVSPWISIHYPDIPPVHHINLPNSPPKNMRPIVVERSPEETTETEDGLELLEEVIEGADRQEIYEEVQKMLDEEPQYEEIPGYYDDIDEKRESVLKGIANGVYRGGPIMLKGTTIATTLKTILNFYKTNHSTEQEPLHSDHLDNLINHCLAQQNIYVASITYEEFGHQLTLDHYDPDDPYSELKLIYTSPSSWRRKYVRSEYYKLLKYTSIAQFDQPCPEVFRIPTFNRLFTQEVIDFCDQSGLWGPGGYDFSVEVNRSGSLVEETHPTVDIQFEQVGLFEPWLQAVHHLLFPLLEVIYPQFDFYVTTENPGQSFIARYKPKEQAYLGLHNDMSTYSLNMALNQRGVDFEGGGTFFYRQNCSVVDSNPGDILVHPGQLTHLHSGLNTTKGTRYILVSFMQP